MGNSNRVAYFINNTTHPEQFTVNDKQYATPICT